MALTIEYVHKEDLKPYAGNAKLHPAEQVEQIKSSIRQFGFNDPIAVWGDSEVVEGHGRLLAVMEMDEVSEVPIIRLDNLSEEQKKAYALVHNKLTMNSGFDFDLLQLELDSLDLNMEEFGFDLNAELDDLIEDEESKYSKGVKIPQYEPTGRVVDESDLVDTGKAEVLIEEINNADVPEATKQFLIEAAHRHSVFNYKNIAEYYANADEKVQELMEKSALVIIDIDDAIANGYVKLGKTISDIVNEDEEFI